MKRTHLILMLDRSGSMSGLEEDTIGGYNGFLKKYITHPNTVVSTVLFDHEQTLLFSRVSIAQAMISEKHYHVRGSTALLDTIGQTIQTVHKEELNDHTHEQRIYIITTDGMENASRTYTYSDIHTMISSERERGHEVIFLGANINISKEATKLGINQDYSHSYSASKKGTLSMFKELNKMVNQRLDK